MEFGSLGVLVVVVIVASLLWPKKSRRGSAPGRHRRASAPHARTIKPLPPEPGRIDRERAMQARATEPSKVTFTYVARKPLHPIEQELYWKLRLAVPSYSVLPQVALSQIVEPIPNIYEAWNPIAQKAVDFLVLRRDFTPLCVIELDGRHHQEQKQREKDAKRDAALQMAGIPVIRWTMRNIPSSEEITALIKRLDQPQPAANSA